MTSVCNGIADCCPESIQRTFNISNLPATENQTHYLECEKTDELGCQRDKTCAINNGGCSSDASCVEVGLRGEPSVCGGWTEPSSAAYCVCPKGLKREYNNGRTVCIDINECLSFETSQCSQSCQNNRGSYDCSCSDGYERVGDGGLCQVKSTSSVDQSPTIFYAMENSIRIGEQDNWNSGRVVVHTRNVGDLVTAFDIDPVNGTLIYAVGSKTTPTELHMAHLTNDKDSLAKSLPMATSRGFHYGTITDMAIDFIAGNLYVVDGHTSYPAFSRIVVSKLNGLYPKSLYDYRGRITSLAVNPLKGALYYATSPIGSRQLELIMQHIEEDDDRSRYALVMTSMNGSVNSVKEIHRCSVN